MEMGSTDDVDRPSPRTDRRPLPTDLRRRIRRSHPRLPWWHAAYCWTFQVNITFELPGKALAVKI
jgi:hypothetical protein